MTKQNIRMILLVLLAWVGYTLYTQYQDLYGPRAGKTPIPQIKTEAHRDIPLLTKKSPEDEAKGSTFAKESREAKESKEPKKGQSITISTDVFNIVIDTEGGDVVGLQLKDYDVEKDNQKTPFILLDKDAKRYYIAQSGLTGEMGPDVYGVGRALYTTDASHYEMKPDEDRLVVDLKARTRSNVEVTKRFVFNRGQYVIDLEYLIYNPGPKDYVGTFYARLKRKPETEASGPFLGAQTFTGAALYTPKTPFKKFSFGDIKDKPFSETIQGGWLAMVEHYFITAWIPEENIDYSYHTDAQEDNTYVVGLVAPEITVKPNSEESLHARLYAGPEKTDVLESLGPGLERSVDYGVLWPICQPLFWVLKQLYLLTGNWGLAIILITILIKLAFYKLSATSFRSMGRMRKLQPKMEMLKERYGDDKQKYSQAVMELYKKEKINPLSGCLPILVQIPVFIALYYMLLGSVELRQAPFILWITDLSAKDPYYVLPILMGVTMVLQQRMSPAPPDPMQAKMMMIMPIVFTALFLNFPAGLVLYWLVNNLLSIGQQFWITRSLDSSSSGLKHGAK